MSSNIDTVQMGYEETAYFSQQPQGSPTSATMQSQHSEVQDALSLAHMLQQLRIQRLEGDAAMGGA